jgi:hypothetical protein
MPRVNSLCAGSLWQEMSQGRHWGVLPGLWQPSVGTGSEAFARDNGLHRYEHADTSCQSGTEYVAQKHLWH